MAFKIHVGGSVIELVQGEISGEGVDAVVRAAGAGEAGCLTGEAAVSTAGRTDAGMQILAVPPAYQGGHAGEARQLGATSSAALALVAEHSLTSVAMPALGTGEHGFPAPASAHVTLGSAIDFLGGHPDVKLIRFMVTDEETYNAYQRALIELAPTRLDGP